MASTRRQLSSVSGSWRMVEGDNDSFDTTVAFFDDDVSPPSSGLPSQLSGAASQGHSQDSIRDFSRHQDDPDNIMRQPFRPSLPSARATAKGSSSAQTPGPELRMPMVDVEAGSRRNPTGARSRGADLDGGDAGLRSRAAAPPGSKSKRRAVRRRYDDKADEPQPRMVEDRIAHSIPAPIHHVLLWLLGIVTTAFRYSQKPLAMLLALYVSFGAVIIAQNMITTSIYASLSPVCRIPGASLLHLPFCPPPPSVKNETEKPVLEFDGLMDVQGKLEDVLEMSVQGVSLPFEMKRSEMSIRDLKNLVKISEIQSRYELIHEFDSYIAVSRQASSDLQRFNVHCGSAVDSVISVNKWTSRYIDSLAPPDDYTPSLLTQWTLWFFSPFQPSDRYFTEHMILDKYIEHTAEVSAKITKLILEAENLLRLLARGEDHLSEIHYIVSRESAFIISRREEVLYTLWSLVGGSTERIQAKQELALLRRVGSQRTSAFNQLTALVVELNAIQFGLEDLRERVAAPGLQRDAPGSLPLGVHIETINRGIERLEAARLRISVAEEERVKEALSRDGIKDGQLLEAPRHATVRN